MSSNEISRGMTKSFGIVSVTMVYFKSQMNGNCVGICDITTVEIHGFQTAFQVGKALKIPCLQILLILISSHSFILVLEF